MVKRTKALFKQGYSDLKSFTLLFFLAKVKILISKLISIEITAKKEKYYFRKISAGNNFGQLRISDGLIFGRKKSEILSRRNFWVLMYDSSHTFCT